MSDIRVLQIITIWSFRDNKSRSAFDLLIENWPRSLDHVVWAKIGGPCKTAPAVEVRHGIEENRLTNTRHSSEAEPLGYTLETCSVELLKMKGLLDYERLWI